MRKQETYKNHPAESVTDILLSLQNGFEFRKQTHYNTLYLIPAPFPALHQIRGRTPYGRVGIRNNSSEH